MWPLLAKGKIWQGTGKPITSIWHMVGQIVPHSVHQVCAIFMDLKKRHDGCLKGLTGLWPGTADVQRYGTKYHFNKIITLLHVVFIDWAFMKKIIPTCMIVI